LLILFPSTPNLPPSESQTANLGEPKTQESRAQHPAFLQNRLLQSAANAAIFKAFAILHGGLANFLRSPFETPIAACALSFNSRDLNQR